jgi:transmembrane sensor
MSGLGEMRAPENACEVEDRAAEWLQRCRYWKNWNDKDQARLDAWLEESATHAVAYWRLVAGMERAERLAALKPQRVGRAANVLKRVRIVLPRASAALAVVAAIGAGAMYWLALPRGQVFQTPVGGHKLVTLADGTRVELDTNTLLHADIAAGRRVVSLDRGEAFFQIVHDSRRPFVVKVAGHEVTDLGTQFLVRAEASHLEVRLVEGRAKIEGDTQQTRLHSALLTPGDVVTANDDSMVVSKKPMRELTRELSWRRGVLEFDNTRLADAAAEFNRYNTQKIVVVGAGVQKLALSDVLPATNVALFVRSVRVLFDLRVETRGNEIILSR